VERERGGSPKKRRSRVVVGVRNTAPSALLELFLCSPGQSALELAKCRVYDEPEGMSRCSRVEQCSSRAGAERVYDIGKLCVARWYSSGVFTPPEPGGSIAFRFASPFPLLDAAQRCRGVAPPLSCEQPGARPRRAARAGGGGGLEDGEEVCGGDSHESRPDVAPWEKGHQNGRVLRGSLGGSRVLRFGSAPVDTPRPEGGLRMVACAKASSGSRDFHGRTADHMSNQNDSQSRGNTVRQCA